jgi:hypothetical protein
LTTLMAVRAQIKIMGEPLLVFLWFDFLCLPSKKI